MPGKLRNSPCVDEGLPKLYNKGAKDGPGSEDAVVSLVEQLVSPGGPKALLSTSRWRESEERAAEFDLIDTDGDGILDRGELAR